MACVGENCAVAHHDEVLLAQYFAPTGDGDEDVAAGSRLERRHHFEALHPRFKRAQWINLADDHRRAKPFGPQRNPLAGPAVADHDDDSAGQQNVGGAEDSVDR